MSGSSVKSGIVGIPTASTLFSSFPIASSVIKYLYVSSTSCPGFNKSIFISFSFIFSIPSVSGSSNSPFPNVSFTSMSFMFVVPSFFTVILYTASSPTLYIAFSALLSIVSFGSSSPAFVVCLSLYIVWLIFSISTLLSSPAFTSISVVQFCGSK